MCKRKNTTKGKTVKHSKHLKESLSFLSLIQLRILLISSLPEETVLQNTISKTLDNVFKRTEWLVLVMDLKNLASRNPGHLQIIQKHTPGLLYQSYY